MNPNSYVNPQQLVNMCILNLSEKKKCKEKNLLSWAVSISVFEYLCAFVFYFCALIIINGLLYKKDVVSVCRSLTLFQGKKKKLHSSKQKSAA